MKERNKYFRFISIFMALAMLASSLGIFASADNTVASAESASVVNADETDASLVLSYSEYVQSFSNASPAENEIALSQQNQLLNESSEAELTDESVWKLYTDSKLAFNFFVENDGFYNLSLTYKTEQEGVLDGNVTVYLDGALPFEEASEQELPRLWKNSGEIKTDSSGNDLRPETESANEWQQQLWRDPAGKQSEPLCFYLSKGTHTVTIQNNESVLYLKAPVWQSPSELISYKQYSQQYTDVPVYGGDAIKIEAENTYRTSSRSLISANDMSSPLTTPYDPYFVRLNTLSGTNWRYLYDRVTWKVTVEQEGLYRLSARFMQNYYNGLDTHRALYINGQIPFSEVSEIAFNYDSKWQSEEFGNYLFYLNAGENTVSLEVVLGEYSEILQRVEALTQNLNKIYRRIIMVTGTSPDIYRDYDIDKEIPGLMEDLAASLEDINTLVEQVKELTGVERSSELSTLNQLAIQIEDVLKTPSTLTKGSRLSRFSSNISSLGTWINKIREQPLLLDSITLFGGEDTVPRAEANFFKLLKHKVDRFIASFSVDYNSMGGSGEGNASITVWLFSGRDQAQLLRDMVDSSFSIKENIDVTVELVSGGLIEAILAGKGPDVALGRADSEPVDYAMRSAALDLSQFSDFDKVTEWFQSGTMRSFRYNGGYYGLPETQTFNMLFCRTDIFDELGLAIPQTWNELIAQVLPVLQQYNMQVGIGNLMEISDSTVFTTLLYQMGGQLYDDDLMTVALDTQIAYEAFEMATELYSDYDVPTEYDFINRFRTGEIPLGIAPYTMYNNLEIAAPEIAGLWKMYEIPGIMQEDGTINNTQVMGSTAAVICGQTSEPEAAWKFLKWWASADVQMTYGNNLEAILGAGGRYTPANVEAMRGLAWKSDQLAQLEAQRSKNTVLPQIPGSYFTKRAVFNAFAGTVLNAEIPREQLLFWSEEIDLELERKRNEFDFYPTKEGE